MSHAARKRRQRRSKGGAARVLLVLFAVVFVGLGVSVIGGVGYVVSIADAVDLDEMDQVDPGAPSVVYAKDGTKLGYLPGPVLRQKIRTSQMGDFVRNATVAVEDRRFYEHSGVDVEGIFRAATRNIAAGGNAEGASTLEMQLIRNLWTKDTTSSLKRKIREAKLAQQLEDRHPGRQGKTWVLTTYLNSAPYGTVGGQQIKGVEAAARAFFNTSAKKMTLAQAAMIAGLPQAPTSYDPYNNPEGALRRRNDVIRRMQQQGYVSATEAVEAQDEPLGVKKTDYFTRKREQYFLDYVRRTLIRKYGAKRVAQGGLKVYTTIDLKKQAAARAAMEKTLPAATDPSSAVVSLNPKTGDIEALANSQPYGKSKFDLASQGKRQPGSTFKVFVLAAALADGISPSKSYPAPGEITIPPYPPVKNFAREGSKGGSMDLVTATLKSVNTVFFRLAVDLGTEKVTRMARDLGITSHLGDGPAEGIGGLRDGITPLENARAYATLANGGIRTTPRGITKVVFGDGTVRRPQPIRAERTVSKAVASEVTRILEKDIQGGTARSAGFGCPAGGKTGTSDKAADVWLAGYTPRLATAVWVGYPGGREPITSTSTAGRNIQGATVAAPIWKSFMEVAHGDFCGQFQGLVPFQGSTANTSSSTGTTGPNGYTGGGSTDGTGAAGGGTTGGTTDQYGDDLGNGQTYDTSPTP